MPLHMYHINLECTPPATLSHHPPLNIQIHIYGSYLARHDEEIRDSGLKTANFVKIASDNLIHSWQIEPVHSLKHGTTQPIISTVPKGMRLSGDGTGDMSMEQWCLGGMAVSTKILFHNTYCLPQGGM